MALWFALPCAEVRGKRRDRAAGILLPALALLSLIGCAGMDFSTLQPAIDERGHYITDVPFFRQEENSCGPAAIASVASFRGLKVTMEEIKARVYLPELRGTLPMDMERYLRDAGLVTASSSGTLHELKAWVRRDVPIICLLDKGFWVYRQPHYIVVIGFDDANRVIIAHDGIHPNTVVSYEKFLKEWGRGGNWMLVALPATQTPETKQ